MPGKRAKNVDEYLRGVGAEKRAALQRLRKTIRSALPKGEECISYGVPAFRSDGKVIVWFAAAAKHCSFFPGGIIKGFEKELARFETSKGTVRFQPDDPIPATTVRKLVRARLQRVRAGHR